MPGPTIQDVLDKLDALEAKLSIRQEYFNEGDDNYSLLRGNIVSGQTFTPNNKHTCVLVKLKIYRVGSPGIITVSIRATSAGKPIGSDLVSGTIDGDLLTTDSSGQWFGILFNPGLLLTKDTRYAITVTATSGNTSNYLCWREQDLGDGYPEENRVYSNDGGSAWNINTVSDMMFEEYSGPNLNALSTYTESQHARQG